MVSDDAIHNFFGFSDLGAQNGCYINGQRLEQNGKKRLLHNDVLRFGNTKVNFKFV